MSDAHEHVWTAETAKPLPPTRRGNVNWVSVLVWSRCVVCQIKKVEVLR